MIRSIPHLFTLGNLVCGVFAITFTMNNLYVSAAVLILFAVICDYFDGKIARRLKLNSEFGVELDSLADLVSFGVAPALIIHTQNGPGILTTLALILFPVCGALRLARFNTKPTHGYFEGIPITFAGTVIAALSFINFAYPIVAICLSVLMISRFRIPKF
ncbi:CDP-diacylglycerol--serine O-phosphatidyltransferase [Fodinisporobacter ferrooxydans]|uniref:CDP-diacylglycerol--serine O-phosphatidyltransferase n=1 Tax=Fodinisporobacter ferrooxydans TaxID=2901836 RepID=A0ABY4CIS4_9BACL|nr:CDP-diacylglycerol--serine O-phosphatidyltransferase [Alicyclobacillaceae bacterium MYW30-H2]